MPRRGSFVPGVRRHHRSGQVDLPCSLGNLIPVARHGFAGRWIAQAPLHAHAHLLQEDFVAVHNI
jgi:hypothetical protein